MTGRWRDRPGKVCGGGGGLLLFMEEGHPQLWVALDGACKNVCGHIEESLDPQSLMAAREWGGLSDLGAVTSTHGPAPPPVVHESCLALGVYSALVKT